jgi:hypothetical protein
LVVHLVKRLIIAAMKAYSTSSNGHLLCLLSLKKGRIAISEEVGRR